MSMFRCQVRRRRMPARLPLQSAQRSVWNRLPTACAPPHLEDRCKRCLPRAVAMLSSCSSRESLPPQRWQPEAILHCPEALHATPPGKQNRMSNELPSWKHLAYSCQASYTSRATSQTAKMATQRHSAPRSPAHLPRTDPKSRSESSPAAHPPRRPRHRRLEYHRRPVRTASRRHRRWCPARAEAPLRCRRRRSRRWPRTCSGRTCASGPRSRARWRSASSLAGPPPPPLHCR
mmetsp:Transcript_55732/g.141058  ORF Transcript_55732/g.141058 Transcript_55732/m.141058 type:complete len:233 (+) Transcript_55732:546-1244(+)